MKKMGGKSERMVGDNLITIKMNTTNYICHFISLVSYGEQKIGRY